MKMYTFFSFNFKYCVEHMGLTLMGLVKTLFLYLAKHVSICGQRTFNIYVVIYRKERKIVFHSTPVTAFLHSIDSNSKSGIFINTFIQFYEPTSSKIFSQNLLHSLNSSYVIYFSKGLSLCFWVILCSNVREMFYVLCCSGIILRKNMSPTMSVKKLNKIKTCCEYTTCPHKVLERFKMMSGCQIYCWTQII